MDSDLESILKNTIKDTLNTLSDYERINKFDIELRNHQKDIIFSSLGLDDPTIVEWRIMGAFVQSVTRKLGDLFEKITKIIIQSRLGLNKDVISGFEYKTTQGHTRSLDIWIPLDQINDSNKKKLIETLIKDLIQKRNEKFVESSISNIVSNIVQKQIENIIEDLIPELGKKSIKSLIRYLFQESNEKFKDYLHDWDKYINYSQMKFNGIGIEVRYAYNIGDSKRIQADLDMAGVLTDPNYSSRIGRCDDKKIYLPVMLIYSNLNLIDPLYTLEQRWVIRTGDDAFNFLKTLTDFDLKKFLVDNKKEFKKVTKKSLDNIQSIIKRTNETETESTNQISLDKYITPTTNFRR